jgi:hypothetical protein
MYANPEHIRNKRVNLSLSDAEMRAVEAISELSNKQPSAFIRELLMDALLGHAANSYAHQPEKRDAA